MTGERIPGCIVFFETGMPHSSYYLLQRDHKLGTFGRCIVSIQVHFNCQESTGRTNNQVSTFTLQDTAALTRLATQIAGETHLLRAQQPADRSTWAFQEYTGMILGSDLTQCATMTEVTSLVSHALGGSEVTVQKVHLLVTGSIRGQVSSFEMRTDTKYNCAGIRDWKAH